MSKALRQVFVWLAFATAMLVPGLARATLLPTCDAHEQLTRAPAPPSLPAQPPQAPPEDACPVPLPAMTGLLTMGNPVGVPQTPPDDLGDVRVAPMCDISGACMVAPQRVLPVSDAQIKPGTTCADDPSTPVIGPGPRHPTSAPAPALAEHAVLDTGPDVPAATSEPAPCFPPVTGGPRPGFVRGIDHPPR